MKIKPYQPTDFHSEPDLLVFLKSLYGANKGFDFWLEEYGRAYNFCCTSESVKFFPLAFFQAEDGIRDLVRSRGLGDVYKRQPQ